MMILKRLNEKEEREKADDNISIGTGRRPAWLKRNL